MQKSPVQRSSGQWLLADAKNRFSEVVRLALEIGPQKVRRRDDAVVILSERDYQKLTGQTPSFKQFLLENAPSFEELDLTRDRSPMREVEL